MWEQEKRRRLLRSFRYDQFQRGLKNGLDPEMMRFARHRGLLLRDGRTCECGYCKIEKEKYGF
jgi:hypothetical protein